MEEWHMPTIASLWRVKDIVAHILDGNIRALSISRDNYSGEPPGNSRSYSDLVSYLNQSNVDWVKAANRVSPKLLVDLIEATGKAFTEHMANTDLFGKAIFPVSWAGETESLNWFHMAREYSEKWIHQQQIRLAVGKESIMTKEFFYPLIETLMRGLPHAYKNITAEINTVIKITVTTDTGVDWYLNKEENHWKLSKEISINPSAEIYIDPINRLETFFQRNQPQIAKSLVNIKGDLILAEKALTKLSVMA